jgi:hypothetical protein
MVCTPTNVCAATRRSLPSPRTHRFCNRYGGDLAPAPGRARPAPETRERNRLKSTRADPCRRALIAAVDAEPCLVLFIRSGQAARLCKRVGGAVPTAFAEPEAGSPVAPAARTRASTGERSAPIPMKAQAAERGAGPPRDLGRPATPRSDLGECTRGEAGAGSLVGAAGSTRRERSPVPHSGPLDCMEGAARTHDVDSAALRPHGFSLLPRAAAGRPFGHDP